MAHHAPSVGKPTKAGVATKAVLRAATALGLSNAILARVIGVSEPTVSRMRSGQYSLEDGKKPFELALLFVRMYRALDAIVGGDDQVAAKWLRNRNVALQGTPIELIETITGLTDVIAYLDTRRAII
jgi:hypothetical protein